MPSPKYIHHDISPLAYIVPRYQHLEGATVWVNLWSDFYE
jgi:hypothetical protein